MFQARTILPLVRPSGFVVAFLASASLAFGQTVTLRSVKDSTIRGGSYSSTNFGDDDILETRQSSDSEYLRRAVLTFDTETTVGDNATISSAKLTLTVKKGNPQTRTVSACTIPISFDETAVNWKKRNGSSSWSNVGGDIVDGECSNATVTSSAGSHVTFDVTKQVQKVLKGTYGSRYARFLVGDVGGSSRDSYKQYYSNDSSSTSSQPTLVVTVGSSSTAPPPAPPPPTGSSSSSSYLRVLQYNTHHGGYGTDGKYDTDRVATWIVKMKPDVVVLNEIEKYTGWGNQDQPEVYKKLLQSKTGKTWYYVFAQEYGDWSSKGKGNLILSSVPFEVTDRMELVHNGDRSIVEGIIEWHGRRITLIGTHLDPDSQTLRLAQATEVTTWAAKEPEDRILTGDMNAWPDQSSIKQFNKFYYDSWTVAAGKGTATAFSGNNGETKNGRIDYIFYSRNSPNLTVKSSQVYDTRDSKGVMPSDHRPVLTVFTVR